MIHLTAPGLDGEACSCLGYYELEPGRMVHGSPVWKQVGGGPCVVRLTIGGNWGVQIEENIGQNGTAWLLLLAPELIYPSEPTDKEWQAGIGGAWVAQPQMACAQVAQLPPPPKVLHLTAPGLGGEPHSCPGYYKLEPGRIVHGSPVWKQARGTHRVARLTVGGNWGVQIEENVGVIDNAWLRLRAPELIYPSEATGKEWEAFLGDTWVAQPRLACDHPVPPAVLHLTAPGLIGGSSNWVMPLVGGEQPWLGWVVALAGACLYSYEGVGNVLGLVVGLIGCIWTGGWLYFQSKFYCTKWLGYYELEPGRTVHGSPVWKQACGTCRVARLSIGDWGVQTEKDVGRNTNVWLHLRAPELIYPSEATGKEWQAWNDGAWVAQPRLLCAGLFLGTTGVQQVRPAIGPPTHMRIRITLLPAFFQRLVRPAVPADGIRCGRARGGEASCRGACPRSRRAGPSG